MRTQSDWKLVWELNWIPCIFKMWWQLPGCFYSYTEFNFYLLHFISWPILPKYNVRVFQTVRKWICDKIGKLVKVMRLTRKFLCHIVTLKFVSGIELDGFCNVIVIKVGRFRVDYLTFFHLHYWIRNVVTWVLLWLYFIGDTYINSFSRFRE